MMRFDPLTLVGGGIFAVGAITTMLSPTQQAITSSSDSIAINAVAGEVAAEALLTQSKLAESRYLSGLCIISTLPITEGMAVPPAYSGQIICDAQGMTAQIANDGRLVLLARAGNQTVISEGLK